MRHTLALSAILTVTGILLAISSLIMVPYTVRNEIKIERSKTWVDEAFVLSPLENRTFVLDSIGENASIFQVDVNSSDLVAFRIVAYSTGNVWFELEGREDFTSYWTPPLSYGIWRFVFHNPSATAVNLSVKLTEYYLKVRDYETIVQYHPLLDTSYGYAGVGLLIATVILNVTYTSHVEGRVREARHNEQHVQDEKE